MRNRVLVLFSIPLLTACTMATDQSGTKDDLALTRATAASLASEARPAEDRGRDARSRPDLVVPLLELEPGARVVDILAGLGYYSEILSRVVGSDGRVYLQNNQGYAALASEGVDKRLADGRLPNVVRWDRELESLDLTPASLDAALIVMSFHDAFWEDEEAGWKIDADAFLASLVSALKPGGRVVIVDHSAVSGSRIEAVGTLHRIDEAFARDRLTEAGLQFESAHDFLRNAEDGRLSSVFDDTIKGRTDRFVLVYTKP